MRVILFFCLVLSMPSYGQLASSSSETYALIIGISNYSDEGVQNLRFAHKDAEVFNDYLESAAGGSVPSDHIKLLTNDDATTSNVYIAMQWLEGRVNKGDLVYFYFSGHGEVDDGVHKLGYFIAHDTPEHNYINFSVRVSDVNNMANNLSAQKDATVVMITDACHSGKLSGSDNSKANTLGELLNKVKKNEIRMASCKPNEISKEGTAWGNGRGAFSFHLVNGLKGNADTSGDMNVSIAELEKYVTTNVSKEVKRLERSKQTPVVQAEFMDRSIALVMPEAMMVEVSISADESQATIGEDKSLTRKRSDHDFYFDELEKYSLKNWIDFRDWATLSNEEIVDRALLVFPIDSIPELIASSWKTEIVFDTRLRNSFKQQLASSIHNEVQKIINAYLSGDKDELERRRFYNAKNSDFDEYAYMLTVAMNLISPNDYLYQVLEIKKHYFSGVATRLKITQIENEGSRDSLIDVSFSNQKKALELDDKAAYIHNEIGILHRLRGDDNAALKSYEKARELEPEWVVPLSNISNIYFALEMYDKSDALAREAVSRQFDYVNAHVMVGKNALHNNNYLLAEDSFLKSSRMNKLSYSSFQGLGEVLMTTTRYEEANRNYAVADSIRRGFIGMGFLDLSDEDRDVVQDIVDEESDLLPQLCPLDTLQFGSQDALAFFAYAYRNYIKGNEKLAIRFFKKMILVESNDPLAHHYLARIYREKNDLTAAELYFKYASEYYLEEEEFNQYVEGLSLRKEYDERLSSKHHRQTFLKTEDSKNTTYQCDIVLEYRNAFYSRIDDIYLLADVHARMSNYTLAENAYWDLIVNNALNQNKNFAPYYLLWELYKTRELYDDAEAIIKEYRSIDIEEGNRELFAFYQEMIANNISLHDYHYKAGLLTYNITKSEFIVREDLQDLWFGKERLDIDGGMFSEEVIPGLDSIIQRPYYIDSPLDSCIYHLTNIDINKDSIELGAIYDKLSEVHFLNGQFDFAMKYYSLSKKYSNDNVSIGLSVIPFLMDSLDYIDAYNILSEVNKLGGLDYSNLELLHLFEVLSSNFDQSDSIYHRLVDVYPIVGMELKEANSLRYLLDEDWDLAIERYNELNADNGNDDHYAYTLSRLYAQLGDIPKASYFLKKASELEFDYYWILINDPLIQPLVNTEIYNKLVKENTPDF